LKQDIPSAFASGWRGVSGSSRLQCIPLTLLIVAQVNPDFALSEEIHRESRPAMGRLCQTNQRYSCFVDWRWIL